MSEVLDEVYLATTAELLLARRNERAAALMRDVERAEYVTIDAWDGVYDVRAYLFAPADTVDRFGDEADAIREAFNRALCHREMSVTEVVASPLSSTEGWRDRISAGLNGPTKPSGLRSCS